jgi:proteasome accessory factor C
LEEGIVDVSFAPTLESVPRLSTRQAAAIVSGLSYLESVLDDSDRAEVAELMNLLSDGGRRTTDLPFKVHPSRVDLEVTLTRQAISEDRLLSCSYINAANEVSSRQIEPISMESSDSIWYLRGYCRTKKEVRVFRLDRMRDIALEKEKLVRAKYLETDSTGIYSVSENDTKVVFDIDPAGFGMIADYKPEYPVIGDKTLRVTIPIGDITTLGRVVRVIEPEAARRVVFEYASRALGSSSSSEKVE